MTNESSPRIDATLVQRLVAEQFPQWSDLPVRPVERSGWDNRSFRLGDDLVARLPSRAEYAAKIALVVRPTRSWSRSWSRLRMSRRPGRRFGPSSERSGWFPRATNWPRK